MLNIEKFARVTENFGFLIKTIYVCGGDVVVVELLGVKTISTLFILMPPELSLPSGSHGEYNIVQITKIAGAPATEYATYLKHLEGCNNSDIFKLGFKHENIFMFHDSSFSSNTPGGLSNELLIFINFKNLCEDMTFLNRELEILRKNIYMKIIQYIYKMCAIEFIREDLKVILERIERYDELYCKYDGLYKKMSREELRVQKIAGDTTELYSHKDKVIGEILYIKDLRENLILSTDILLCEIEHNHSNIKHVSVRLKELF